MEEGRSHRLLAAYPLFLVFLAGEATIPLKRQEKGASRKIHRTIQPVPVGFDESNPYDQIYIHFFFVDYLPATYFLKSVFKAPKSRRCRRLYQWIIYLAPISIAKNENILLIDLDIKIPKNKEFIYDTFHLNDKGSLLAAKIISSELIKSIISKN